jgi:hypothetical protein
MIFSTVAIATCSAVVDEDHDDLQVISTEPDAQASR